LKCYCRHTFGTFDFAPTHQPTLRKIKRAKSPHPLHFCNFVAMADVFSKKKRSEIMSKIRARNTKPELVVRKYLFSKGFRFRLHQSDLPGKPDIVLKKYKTVILVNGCLWHGHKNCKRFIMPKSRLEYWTTKIQGNITKDKKNKKALKKMGWKIIEIWTCQLTKNKADLTLKGILNKLTP
jgi:DNA mismatch endonuclease (patch repair protein)